MNKSHLIQMLERMVRKRREASAAVEAIMIGIQGSLRAGDKVVLAGIGSLHVKMRKAKVGRNPKTGVVVPIPPRRAVKFRPSKDLFHA